MKARETRLGLQAVLVLLVFGAAVPLRSQTIADDAPAYLDVCNKGTVSVVAVEAKKFNDFDRGVGKYFWRIKGTAIAPGKCKHVSDSGYNGEGAYLAFGFADAKGQWGSGKITKVPDFGNYIAYFREHPILTSASKGVCARQDETEYGIDDDPQIDCAGLRLTNVRRDVGHGPFLPITSSLYFESKNKTCLGDYGAKGPCQYYLNITPSGSDRELHAVEGTSGGADVKDDPPTTLAQDFKALVAAVAKLREKYPAPPPPPPPPAPPKRNPRLTVTAPEHDGFAIKMDPSLTTVLTGREQEKWKSPLFMVSAYDPKWIGQTLVLKGTVSRVEVERDGDPKWVHIYFKESPGATVTGCSPFPEMLRKTYGNDLSILVGKTIEMAGQVEKFCQPNISIRIVDPMQIKVVH